MARLVEVDEDGKAVNSAAQVDGVLKLGAGGKYSFVGEGAPQKQPEASTLERAMALPAGLNRAAYTNLLGLPVDTVANVIDLGKAALGTPYTAITGKPAPDFLQVAADRKNVVGSADWLADKMNTGAAKIGVRSPIDNPRPDDAVSRLIYSAGLVGGSSITPDPRAKISGAQQLTNLAIGGTSGLISGAVAEKSPEWAGAAGMLPSLGIAAGSKVVKTAVRGREAGRQEMAQRMQDLKNGGIDEPSVGLASGNRFLMGLENLLSQTPGTSGLYNQAKEKMVGGMQAKANQIRDNISPTYGALDAGDAIQRDLTGSFKARINQTTRALNDRVENAVGPNFFTNPESSLATSRSMSTPVPGAPKTSGGLLNPRIASIADNLASDVVGTPIPGNPLMNEPTRYQRHDGVISDVPPGIPFRTLKNLRTSIGEEANSNAIMGTPEQSQFKRLYGAMSDDMRQAVNAADRNNAGVPVGPLQPSQQPGAIALTRANDYYSKAMGRVEDLNALANRSTPEGAYQAVSSSLNNGPTVYQRLRGAVTPETRQKIAATVIDEMGMAKAGQQGADGDKWSPATFLTNYNKMDANARSELFKRLPSGAKHADNLHDIAKAAEMLGDSSKVWANPSGTAPALTARGTAYALTIGAFLQPMLAGATAAGLGLSHEASKRLLLNPKFSNWLTQARSVNPNDMQRHAQRLVQTANFTKDKKFKDDVSEYLSSIENGLNNQVDNEAGAGY